MRPERRRAVPEKAMRKISALYFSLAVAVAAFAQKSPMEHAKVWLGIHAGIRAADQYALRVVSPILGEPDLHYAWYSNHAGLNTVAESPKVMVQITPGVKYWMYVSSGSWHYADVHFNPPPGYVIKLSGSWLERTPRLTHRTNDYNGSFGTYYIDFELVPQDGVATLPAGYALPPSVGDITWAVSAGRISTGASASALRWRATTVTQGLLDALALRFSDVNHDEVYTYTYSDGAPKYLSTEQAQLYVRRNAGANSGYTIEAYGPHVAYSYANNDPANDWTFGSTPFATYAITNPDTSWLGRVRITRTQDGVAETWTLAQSGSTTTLEQSNSLQKITLASSTVTSTAVGEIYPGDPTGTSYRREVATVTDAAGNNLATKAVRYYRGFVWGEELVREIANPDGTNSSPLTTSYTYYDSGWAGGSFSGNVTKLKSVSAPDGSWSKYEYYDDFTRWGQLKAVFRPWQESAGVTAENASPTNCHYTTFTYTAERDIFQDLPLAIETRVLGTTTAKTEVASYGIWNNNDYITFPNQVQQVRDETFRTYTAAGSYLTTTRRVFHKSAVLDYEGKLFSQTNPDGTKVSAAYVKGHFSSYFNDPALWDNALFSPGNSNTWWCDSFFTGTAADPGDATQVATWNGKSIDPVWMTPNRSTRRDVLRAIDGTMVFEITYLYTGGGSYKLIDWTYAEYTNGLVTLQRDRTGAVVTRTYTAGRVSYETAADGTQTQYYFDDLRRVTRAERKGVGATAGFSAQDAINTYYTYDAANRVVATSISPASGSLTLSTAASYNPAGQLLSQTANTGLVTTFSHANGGRTVTTTHPGGATTVTERYVDGSTKSVTGSAQVASTHALAVNGDGTITLTTYAGPSGTSSPRWSKMTTDWVGRTYWQQSPTTAAGVTFDKVSIFNTAGQLVRIEETNLANTLYQYDGLGELEYTALDVNGNGSIDLTGPDRVTSTRSKVVNNGGVWSAESSTYVLNQENSATPIRTGRALRRLVPYLGSSTDFSNFRVLTESRSYDVFGNETITTLNVDRSTRVATTTTNVPDSSIDAVETTFNGLKVRSQTPQNLAYYSYYDGLGRLLKTTDPRTDTSTTPRIGYYAGTAAPGSRHQVAWRQDSAGNQTDYTYDDKGRLVVETMPAAVANGTRPTRRFAYNLRGQTIQTWGSGTYPVEAAFNGYGELIAQRTFRDGTSWDASAWPRTDSGIDANNASNPMPSGWTRSTSDVTTWDYDANTGLLKMKTPPFDPASADANLNSAKPISYTYDARGQIKTRTWARGVVTNYHYFGESAGEPKTGELRKVDYADTLTTDLEYTYSRAGQTASVLDATGTRQFAYDSATMALQTETLGAGFYIGRQLEHLTATTGVKGRSIGYKLKAGATVEQEVGYDYDAVTGRFNLLREGSAASPVATFAYGYAANSNLIASIADTATGWTQTRTYLPNRHLLDVIETKMGVAPKTRFDYAYDNLGRRTTVEKTGEMFARYAVGGLKTSWGYNPRSELTGETTERVTGTGTEALPDRAAAFGYDEIGNRKTATHHGQTSTYTPNLLNQYSARTTPAVAQLSGLAPAAASVTFKLNADVVGSPVDRLGEYFFKQVPVSLNAWSTLLTESSASRAAVSRGLFVPAASEAFAYDADGNLKSDGRSDYTYDAENRLLTVEPLAAVKASAPASLYGQIRKLEFIYDYLGRRVQKTVHAGWNGSAYTTTVATRFIYQGWNLIGEYAWNSSTSTLALSRSYLWGLDWSGTSQGAGGVGGLQLMRDLAAGWNFVPAYDGNGNVMGLMHQSGGSLGSFAALFEYDAFGQTIRAEGPQAASAPFRFSTKFTDLETGLVYYGKRYYSPSFGRFINRDPIEESGGLNLYGFCGNDAINHWDYLGMQENIRWLPASSKDIVNQRWINEVGDGPEVDVVGQGVNLYGENPISRMKALAAFLGTHGMGGEADKLRTMQNRADLAKKFGPAVGAMSDNDVNGIAKMIGVDHSVNQIRPGTELSGLEMALVGVSLALAAPLMAMVDAIENPSLLAPINIAGAVLAGAGTIVGVPASIITGDVFDTYTVAGPGRAYMNGIFTSSAVGAEAAVRIDAAYLNNNSHFFGAGDIAQIVFDSVGVITMPSVNAALSAFSGTNEFVLHSQGTATGSTGLRLVPAGLRSELNLIGLGGQWNLNAGVLGVNSAVNYRASRDPVPYLWPVNLISRAIPLGNTANLTVSNQSDRFGFKNHHFDTTYEPYVPPFFP